MTGFGRSIKCFRSREILVAKLLMCSGMRTEHLNEPLRSVSGHFYPDEADFRSKSRRVSIVSFGPVRDRDLMINLSLTLDGGFVAQKV